MSSDTNNHSTPAFPTVLCDGVSHHPLGGPSHTYKTRYINHVAKTILRKYPNNKNAQVNLVFQPNSSAHAGTLVSFMFSFAVAKVLKACGLQTTVVLDYQDNGNSARVNINGLVYQKGLRACGLDQQYMGEYEEIAQYLAKRNKVDYIFRSEDAVLSNPKAPGVIRWMISNREELGFYLSPGYERIMIRSSCPVKDCGLVDKACVNNEYDLANDKIHFVCPHHGKYAVHIATETPKLQFNMIFWSLFIEKVYEYQPGYVQIVGSDYAGYWMDEVRRHVKDPTIILWTPLIVDWSGAKISKSLYLKGSAYDYLKKGGMAALCSYEVFRAEGRDLGVLCDEVDLWMTESFRAFRPYSIHYLYLLLLKDSQLQHGTFVFQATDEGGKGGKEVKGVKTDKAVQAVTSADMAAKAKGKPNN